MERRRRRGRPREGPGRRLAHVPSDNEQPVGQRRALPDISILIPTKNAGPEFETILAAIAEQDIEAEVEVLVVDSGSVDGTPELAAAAGARVHRIPPRDFGHGRTRNLLASLAAADILVFLSADALPASPQWLRRLVEPLAEAQVAATFGRQLPRPGCSPMQRYFLQRWYPDRPSRRLPVAADPAIGELFYSHVNAALKKSVWRDHQIDETLPMSEDQAWSRSVLRAGFAIAYEPRAAVIHSHSYTIATVFQRNFDSGASLAEITSERSGDWLRHGLAYVVGEAWWMGRSGHALRVPYAIFYEAARFVGFWCGRNQRFLPRALKRRLSHLAHHW